MCIKLHMCSFVHSDSPELFEIACAMQDPSIQVRYFCEYFAGNIIIHILQALRTVD